MFPKLSSINLIIIGTIFIKLCVCSQLSERIYSEIQANLACIKRLNGTSEIGCTSSFWGNTGIIHLVDVIQDLKWLIKYGDNPPYMILLKPDLFSAEILNMASKSGKLAGVLLLASDNYSIPDSFSTDQHCPNNQNSLYVNSEFEKYCENTPWNPYGSSLLFQTWNFPIFLITEEESINKIIACYHSYNNPNNTTLDWPFCTIELESHMHAAVSSEVCLRRSEYISNWLPLCEPLEDINIWGGLYPLNLSAPIQDETIIILSSSTDSASLFDEISPGADATLTGLITLLLTAEHLSKHRQEVINSNNYILFSIFEGEAWNYIGSTRMVYDMINKNFPSKSNNKSYNINLNSIHSIIDLKQVGFIRKNNGEKSIFLHSDPLSKADDSVAERTQILKDILTQESSNMGIIAIPIKTDIPLPPSSAQSFLKEKKIPALVITDHDQEYQNKYYMGFYDNAKQLGLKFDKNGSIDDSDYFHKDIAKLSSILASTFLTISTGRKGKFPPNDSLAKELLYCFLQNMNCTYFQENSDDHLKKFLEPTSAKTFISVKRANNPLTAITLRLLSRFTGHEVNISKKDCKSNNTQPLNLEYFPFVNNGTCFESSIHHSQALSPAFEIKNYDWKSNKYSTWTESTWSVSKARMYLKPSPHEEISLMIGGFISLLLSFIFVHFMHSKSNEIFVSEVPVTLTAC